MICPRRILKTGLVDVAVKHNLVPSIRCPPCIYGHRRYTCDNQFVDRAQNGSIRRKQIMGTGDSEQDKKQKGHETYCREAISLSLAKQPQKKNDDYGDQRDEIAIKDIEKMNRKGGSRQKEGHIHHGERYQKSQGFRTCQGVRGERRIRSRYCPFDRDQESAQ